MRALVRERYGAPLEVLQVKHDEPEPVAGLGQVVVQVEATSLNPWDWDLVTGNSQGRVAGGWRSPRWRVLGCDIAGRVVAVGPGVERLAVGDEVFGDDSGAEWGGLGERVAVREEVLARRPASMTPVQAAAIPQAGVLALQALRMADGLRGGCRVLFNGAGGGVGTLGLQLARSFGATVDGVDRGDKLEQLRALGADRVFDHTREDVTRQDVLYDAVIDVVGKRPLARWRRVLAPGGRYVMVGGTWGRIAETLALGAVLGRMTGQRFGLLIHRPGAADVEQLASWFEEGRFVPVIDRVVGLDEAPRALVDLGAGDVVGKVVVNVQEAGDGMGSG